MFIISAVVGMIVKIGIGVIIADITSGVIHWLQDKYGNPDWPLVGFIFAANQRHHEKPLEFLGNTFWKRNGVTFGVATFLFLMLTYLFGSSLVLWTVYLVGAFSNEIHAYAHRKNNPKWVVFLQKYGIMISPANHAIHHKDFKSNFCVVTSWLNIISSLPTKLKTI